MESFNIGAVAGAVLSLAFKYVTKLNAWFDKQEPEKKELVMLGTIVVVVAGAFGLSCIDWLEIYACTQAGLKDAVFALVGAVVGNQGTYLALSHQKE